jgi:hypothetical protein
MFHGPGLPPEQRIIEYDRDIKPGKVLFTITDPETNEELSLVNNESLAKFKMDYYDIFNGIEPSDFEFLKFVTLPINNEVPPELKLVIDTLNASDDGLFSDLKISKFLREYLIKSVNRDLVFSSYLKSAVVFDQAHHDLISRKLSTDNELTHIYNPEVLALKRLIQIPSPNFYNMEIAEAIDLREDSKWAGFRNAVTNITYNIQENSEILYNQTKLKRLVDYYCDDLMMNELKKSQYEKMNLSIDLGLSIFSNIPGIGALFSAVSAIDSIYKYKNNSSWSAFIMKLKQFK